MEELSPFAVALNVTQSARLRVAPARTAVLSWNSYDDAGRLQFRLLRAGVPATDWYDFAEWHEHGRKSFSARSDSDGLSVDVDVITAIQPFDGVDMQAEGVDFGLVAVSTPVAQRPSLPYAGEAMILDVAPQSQYVVEGERGWCSPASLSMLHAYHGVGGDVATTARAVEDRVYNGTGNWSFNTAYSGACGLRAVVAYLANLDHAARLIERGIPLALSYAWSSGELPGAPIEHSAGHLAVLCGFTANGDCAVNDPAAPGVRMVYPRRTFEALWQRSGGIAYVVAPAGKEFFDILTTP